MQQFDPRELKKLYIPPSHSHKGQNGKLLFIGGSHLFHAATIWPLTIASRIVDMVFYSSVPENNEIIQKAKEEFRNGMVVVREDLEDYVKEADAILIGPGMVRAEHEVSGSKYQVVSIRDIDQIEDEGEQAYFLTKYLLEKYPNKKWVIDAGALQMMDPEWLKELSQVIITPHPKEFRRVFTMEATKENIETVAREYGVVVVVKGERDIVCSKNACVEIVGGNAGMTKGGTGDVLAGLIAALATKNDMLLSAEAGAYINKKAGESLFKRVGYYFNATDLVNEVPVVMKELIATS
jgi:hydroxyethylthiazole kinase-like uncharacterized protein yjeF